MNKQSIFRWATLCVMLGAAIPLQSNAAIIVSFDTSAASVNAGETFEVDVVADIPALEAVLGWGIDIASSDPAIALQVGVPVIGPLWSAAPTMDGDGLAGLAFPLPISGVDVVLATLTFEALSIGVVDLAASISPLDFTEGFPLAPPASPGSLADVTFLDLSITVEPALPVPEPGTGFVVALGLAGIVVAQRRKSTRA